MSSQTVPSSSSNSQSPDPSQPVTMAHLSGMYQSLANQQQQQFQQVLAVLEANSRNASQWHATNNPIFQQGPATRSAEPLPHKVKLSNPSNFEGNREINVDAWLFEMLQYLNACGVSEDQRVTVASSYLKKGALQWWFNQSSLPAASRPKTWEAFATGIRTRFQPVAASRVARAQLRTLRQDKMSIAEYCNKFNSIMNLIPDMAEADQIEAFTLGLRYSLQRDLAILDPTTLNDAMIKAQKMESITSINAESRRYYTPSPSSSSADYYFHPPTSSASSSPSSTTPTSQTPMELGNVTVDSEEPIGEIEEALVSNEYDRYLEQGDEYDQEGLGENEEEEPHHLLQAIQRRPNPNSNRNTAPFLSQEEFTRRMNQGLCLRCARPGHVSRNCPTRNSSIASFNSNKRITPNRSFPPRSSNGQFQSSRTN
jgi:hypothetical protein